MSDEAKGGSGPMGTPGSGDGALPWDGAPGAEELARLLELAADYHRPPETPREAMWEALEARLRLEGRGAPGDPSPGGTAGRGRALTAVPGRAGGGAERRPGRFRRFALDRVVPAWWGAAAAAVLLLGIAVGRLTAPSGAGVQNPAVAEAPAGPAGAAEAADGGTALAAASLQAVTTEHLNRTEALLALVQTDASTGRLEPGIAGWGRSLLVETRLLLDSPAGQAPALRELLEDLELILSQVALLEVMQGAGEVRGREELRLIAQGLDERSVLPRIQAVLPAAEAGVAVR